MRKRNAKNQNNSNNEESVSPKERESKSPPNETESEEKPEIEAITALRNLTTSKRKNAGLSKIEPKKATEEVIAEEEIKVDKLDPSLKPIEENGRQYESFSLKDDYMFIQAIIEYQKEKKMRKKFLENLSEKLERTVCSIRRRWERLSQFTKEQQEFVCQYYEKFLDKAKDRKISFKTDAIVQSLRDEDDISDEETELIARLKLEILGIEESESSIEEEPVPEEPEDIYYDYRKSAEESRRNQKSDHDKNDLLSNKSSIKSIKESSKEKLDFQIDETGLGDFNQKSINEFNDKLNEQVHEGNLNSNVVHQGNSPNVNDLPNDANEENEMVEERNDVAVSNEIVEDGNEAIEKTGLIKEEDKLKDSPALEEYLMGHLDQDDRFKSENIRKTKFKRIKHDFVTSSKSDEFENKLGKFKLIMADDNKCIEEKTDLLVELMTYFSQTYDCPLDELIQLFDPNHPVSIEDIRYKICYRNIMKRGRIHA